MLVTNTIEDSPIGGREMLCKMNHEMLNELYGYLCSVYELNKSPIRGAKSIANTFKGHIDGVSGGTIAAAFREIEKSDAERNFVDGSNLGEFVRAEK